MNNNPVYIRIAQLLSAYNNCKKEPEHPWTDKHKDRIQALVKQFMPSGSGFDSGTKLDFDASTPDKLIFNTAFHHLNDGGFYDGWTDHKVIVTPCLAFGFSLRVTGQNKRDIKDYIAEYFHDCLSEDTTE